MTSFFYGLYCFFAKFIVLPTAANRYNNVCLLTHCLNTNSNHLILFYGCFSTATGVPVFKTGIHAIVCIGFVVWFVVTLTYQIWLGNKGLFYVKKVELNKANQGQKFL
jgi:hypothetical protein